MDSELEDCEGLSKNENPLYLRAKEEALKIAKPFPILQADFVETLAMVFEESHEITGGRAAELMERVTHLLKCLKACHRHKLMREVMGLDNKQLNGDKDHAV
jgi:hypothetical protein